MSVGIIGQKLGMTQIYDVKGHLIPVTVIQAGPCPVVQIKTKAKDGYSAIQLGFQDAGRKKLAHKALKGHFKNSGAKPTKILKEFKIENPEEFSLGQLVTIDQFKPSQIVKITGISKGRGFAGVIKRHGFAGKHAGHGTHEYFRHGGSIGCRTPKHVIRGMRMPGRMGNVQVSVKSLKIMVVDKSNNLLLIKGAIPGWNGGYIVVHKP
jgi:large subunit ribosomal protein L3